MPSEYEQKRGLSFAVKLTLTITIFFLIGAIGLYLFAYGLVGEAMEDLWNFVPWKTARAWSAEPARTSRGFFPGRPFRDKMRATGSGRSARQWKPGKVSVATRRTPPVFSTPAA